VFFHFLSIIKALAINFINIIKMIKIKKSNQKMQKETENALIKQIILATLRT